MDERVRLERRTASGVEEVEARIRPRLGESELRQIESWRPLLRELGEGDRDWDWRKLAAAGNRKPGEGMEAATLILERRVQAVLLLRWGRERSRLDGRPLVYVDHIAVAPQNRSGAGRSGRISRCGNAMMIYARQRSRRLGFGGRVGLHSLRESEGFYLNLGMQRLAPGADDEGFAYFEWASEELR